jgi:quercetin dioxygenase-like cupin family protein
MSTSFSVFRLTEDQEGTSYFDRSETVLELQDFAPPASPFYVSPTQQTSSYVVVRFPAGWVGQLHRSPARQMLFGLSGAIKVTAGNGETCNIGPGQALLMGDTRGSGHMTEVISAVPCDALIIRLAPSP